MDEDNAGVQIEGHAFTTSKGWVIIVAIAPADAADILCSTAA
jgi:hypothetical protein